MPRAQLATKTAPTHINIKQEFFGLNLIEAGKRADELGDIPRLSITTVNDKIGAVSTFFRWVCTNFDGQILNPCEGLKIRDKTSARSKRAPFSMGELNKIFSASIYTEDSNENHWSQESSSILRKPSKFWVPLIGLFTGMRLGEIIQLTDKDVQTEGEITFFDVNEIADWKKLKSNSSTRQIPVHPELIKFGFLDFVKTRNGRLFSDFKQNKAESWSDSFSKYFRRHTKEVGVNGSFHQFRHLFEDACRNNDVSGDIMDALQGHSQKAMRGVYGTGFGLRVLGKAMQQISYDQLNLKHLE